MRKGANELVEGFGCAPVFLFLIGGELERDDRHRKAKRLREPARIVLNEFSRAGCADDQCFGLEALVGFGDRALEKLGRVTAEVARLEGRIGDRRALLIALDHREQEIGVGIALRRMQHVMDAAHRIGDAESPDVGWPSYVQSVNCMGYTPSRMRRSSGRANNSARSAACSNPCTGLNKSSIDHLVVIP